MKAEPKGGTAVDATGGRRLAIAPADRGDNDAGRQYRDAELLRLRRAPRTSSPYDPDVTRAVRERIRRRFGWT
jgi:hypothetical protein